MATNIKKEFSAVDAAPVILYVKQDANSEKAFPFGGIQLPPYDYVSLTPPSLPTSITFYTGGSGGTLVATLTLTYSGTDLSSVART